MTVAGLVVFWDDEAPEPITTQYSVQLFNRYMRAVKCQKALNCLF